MFRGVVPGGAVGAMAPPNFGRLVNPITTRGVGILCPPNNTGTPGFSDLPTAYSLDVHCLSIFNRLLQFCFDSVFQEVS